MIITIPEVSSVAEQGAENIVKEAQALIFVNIIISIFHTFFSFYMRLLLICNLQCSHLFVFFIHRLLLFPYLHIIHLFFNPTPILFIFFSISIFGPFYFFPSSTHSSLLQLFSLFPFPLLLPPSSASSDRYHFR